MYCSKHNEEFSDDPLFPGLKLCKSCLEEKTINVDEEGREIVINPDSNETKKSSLSQYFGED